MQNMVRDILQNQLLKLYVNVNEKVGHMITVEQLLVSLDSITL